MRPASFCCPRTDLRQCPQLFGTIFNWVLYGVLCVQICMSPVLETSSYFTHQPSDVYGYNFPNDSRSVKSLGWSWILLESSVMSRLSLCSLFRLLVGDCSNRTHWDRHLLLVYCWIWQCGSPHAFSFRPRRHSPDVRGDFVHCSRILLLSNLGAEQ